MSMKTAQSSSIKRKLTQMSMLASSGALLLACVSFVVYEVVTFKTSMVRSATIRAQLVASNTTSALTFLDQSSAESTLRTVEADEHVRFAGLYDKKGKLFANYSRDTGYEAPTQTPNIPNNYYQFVDGNLILLQPVFLEGEQIGTVYIRSDIDELYLRLEEFSLIGFGVLIAACVLAFVISSRLQRSISGTVLHLADIAKDVSQKKDYSLRATVPASDDELQLLTKTFNDMLTQIQERDHILQEERREVEAKIQERTAELQAANKDLESFTYSVSHDLRAPLRHIDGFSKLLVELHESELSEDAKEYLSFIRQGTREMSQLVEDLLDLARIGRRELRLEVAGLDGLVREIVNTFESETASRQIQWKIEELPFLECDASLMKQVFVNLLSNAVKYTRKRERAVIEVGLLEGGSGPVIFVRDNGVGFDMKHANKLFGVFQRLHRQEDFEGTGVGLAIVQRIVHKHAGHIWAEAELNRGATFFIALGGPSASDQARTAVTAASR